MEKYLKVCAKSESGLSMTTNRPPLPMANIDPGIGSNISKYVQKVWVS